MEWLRNGLNGVSLALAIILGTRPEIIKLSPVIRECESKEIPFFILHTGQHYSYSMDKKFFEDLDLKKPKYNLEIGSGSHGQQTGNMVIAIERILVRERPTKVIVQGDTNTVLSGALAASKLNIEIAHVEAGLRSFDRSMPEEINRVLTDHISSFLFVPTEGARRNLLNEGLSNNRIYLTGNTIVDALYQNLDIAKIKSTILSDLNLKARNYILVTVHRQENVDNSGKLKAILDSLNTIAQKFDQMVLFPMHPRTRKMTSYFDLNISNKVEIMEPLGFLDFLQLEANANLMLTDSGGIQEESCILGVPCVTLRENTERPETLEAGSNILSGSITERIVDCCMAMMGKSGWRNPFGDGNAAKAIINAIEAP